MKSLDELVGYPPSGTNWKGCSYFFYSSAVLNFDKLYNSNKMKIPYKNIEIRFKVTKL